MSWELLDVFQLMKWSISSVAVSFYSNLDTISRKDTLAFGVSPFTCWMCVNLKWRNHMCRVHTMGERPVWVGRWNQNSHVRIQITFYELLDGVLLLKWPHLGQTWKSLQTTNYKAATRELLLCFTIVMMLDYEVTEDDIILPLRGNRRIALMQTSREVKLCIPQ